MRLKTKLVLAITGLVFAVVVFLSWIWLSQLLQQHIDQSWEATDILAHQISFQVNRAIDSGLRGRQFDSRDPVAVRAAVAESLREDSGLNSLLNSIVNYSPTVLDVAVADRQNRAIIAAPDATQDDQILPNRRDYSVLRRRSLIQTLKIVFGPPQVYNVSLGLDLSNQPFLTIRIGIRTTFLRNAFRPWLYESFSFMGLAMIISIVVAAFVANLALQPLEQISRRLDALTAQEADAEPAAAARELKHPVPTEASGALATVLDPLRRGNDAVAQVSGKIERLGQRIRNVEEVFSALRENLDQILTNLQDGVMLFTRDARAVLVSSSVERFLNIGRDRIFGAEVRDIFDRNTRLGRIVRDAFEAGMSIVQEEVVTETGRRVEVSLDFIHDAQSRDRQSSLGALLTLHDLESVREIESELEVSRRMASIGRLTAGVGHEVKNPINAIVVHLELLRNKVHAGDDALRHLDIIQSEIRRLDRVVQTLVDFSRPVELQLKDQDLRGVVSSVLMLASAEFQTRGITVESQLPSRPVISRVDADLLEQALLNIVLNGAQAMATGGALEVRLSEDSRWASILVRDHGEGIPDEIRARIFDLYFTTKKEGSGIGLAMTYRILQMHHGQIDVESKPGSGTTFVLRLPLTSAGSGQRGILEVTGDAIPGELARQGGETQPERSGA
jgi:signal transduction histidine kinase